MVSTAERLGVLETKVQELATQTHNMEKKVDVLIELVNKGNFDSRITRLEKNPYKWIAPIIYTIFGAVMTFLILDYLEHI